MRGLDTPLTVQTLAETTASGVTTRAWTGGGTVWARVEEQTGRERLRAGQVDGDAAAVVTVRYEAGAALGHGARFVRADGRVLDVVGPPREVGRRAALEFVCRQHGGGA